MAAKVGELDGTGNIFAVYFVPGGNLAGFEQCEVGSMTLDAEMTDTRDGQGTATHKAVPRHARPTGLDSEASNPVS